MTVSRYATEMERIDRRTIKDGRILLITLVITALLSLAGVMVLLALVKPLTVVAADAIGGFAVLIATCFFCIFITRRTQKKAYTSLKKAQL